MRRLFALALFLIAVPSAAYDVCPNVYFSGWYCDGGYAVHCAYSYAYDELYEDNYIDCSRMPNSNGGCFAGSCSCQLFGCAHGITNRDCSCTCSYPWSGSRCDYCVKSDSECAPNGYMNRQTCQCQCAAGCLNGGTQSGSCACSCPASWSGPRCETCTRSSAECANGGYMDSKTCQCVCPNGCANGGTQDKDCKCACSDPWKGPRCESCSLSQGNCENGSTINTNQCRCDCNKECENGGTLTRTCGCSCPYPWTGGVCTTCSVGAGHCKNNANFTASACACDCSDAQACENGSNRKSDFSCGCECVNGYKGDTCSTCGRDAAFCERGGAFKEASCNCDCASAGACKNGKLNERCQCLCAAGFKGDDCSVASAAYALAPSVIGMISLLAGFIILGS